MELILQHVARSQTMSFLDGLFGYNKILVKRKDYLKMNFTTIWGTFTYDHTPFNLINVGSTFLGAMHIAFEDLICVIM